MMPGKIVVSRIEEEIPGFKTLYFSHTDSIIYESGQFLTLMDPDNPDQIRRSYSLLSSPVLNEPLAISVKRIDNGYFSRKLVDDTKVGDVFFTIGASGFFRLPVSIETYSRIFFFAAGSGIVPVMSLLKTALVQYPPISIHLVYSNHSPGTTAFRSELQRLEKQFSGRLSVHFLFSISQNLRRARLNREELMRFVSLARCPKDEILFYTCGPESYMRMVLFTLLEEGFPKENIRKEEFNPGNKKVSLKQPPDTGSYRVIVTMNEEDVEFIVHYPHSILESARSIKLNLPYSCETGKCGTCAAICTEGTVWLSNNEVLTDEDLQKGFTLTCTGHPQNGPVKLTFAR